MGESIHQEAGDGAIQIGRARDVTLNLVTGITRLPTNYASLIQNFLTEYLGTPEQPVPFGGRDAVLARLDTWLADLHASPYLLLVAPAGRGKSALLVRWSQRLLTQSDTSLVFVPISIRFRTNLASVVFAALAARLAHLHGEEVLQTTDFTAEQWRSLVSAYLARALPDRRSLLLILDGVDEAADWEPGADLFPLAPPPGLRVIVSVRYRAGDADAAPWLRRLGWERPGLARLLDLDPLARAGVVDVLQKMGFPLDVLAKDVDIVTELHRLSEGDPLLVRLYVDDLWARGEAAARLRPENLRAIRPGLKGYFDRWWEDQHRLWGPDAPLKEPAVQALLNLLACALGPLNQEDVLALAGDQGLTTWTLEEALRPLARLVIGDGKTQGYVFSHPRLREYFHERLIGAERLAWEQRFLDWGRQILSRLDARKLAPEQAPAYVVQYYGAHLERKGGPAESLFALVSDGWRRAWGALEGANHASFLTDVERASRAAKMINEVEVTKGCPAPHLGVEVRNALCRASVNSLAQSIPPALLAALVEHGVWTLDQGLAYARYMIWPEDRAQALAGLIPRLPNLLKSEALQEGLAAARAIGYPLSRARALAGLVPYLPEPEREQVLREGLAILAWTDLDDSRSLYKTLTSLAAHLTEPLLREALVMVRRFGHEHLQAEALAALAPRLAQLGYSEEALAAVRAIRDKQSQAVALAGLAPQLSEPLKEELLREALAVVRKIRYKPWRAEMLMRLAPHLLEPQWGQVLRDALAAARASPEEVPYGYGYRHPREEALAQLAPLLAKLGYQEEALKTARAIEGKRKWYEEALPGLALYLPEPLKGETLREALAKRRLFDLNRRADALKELALHLIRRKTLLEKFAAMRRFLYKRWQREALVSLLSCLPETLLKWYLAVMRAIPDNKWRWARVLERVAPHMSEPLLREALAAAIKELNYPALAGLAPRLAELGYAQESLKVAWEIKSKYWQVWALVGIVPHLPEWLRGEVLKDVLAVARAIEPEWRERELAKLAPRLAELGYSNKALAAAREIENANFRAEALNGLAPHLAELPLATLYSLWHETLLVLSARTRYHLLSDLRALAPVIAALGGSKAVAETFRAIQDVGRWWP